MVKHITKKMRTLPAATFMHLFLFLGNLEKCYLYASTRCEEETNLQLNYLTRIIEVLYPFDSEWICVSELNQPRFIYLERLDINDNQKIKCLNKFKYLKEIHIGWDCGVDDAGISELMFLEIICCRNNRKITNLNKFSKLREINIGGDNCCVNDKGISQLLNLEKVIAHDNFRITFHPKQEAKQVKQNQGCDGSLIRSIMNLKFGKLF